MEPLPNHTSRRSEVHSKTDANLALHHNILRCFHPNGLSLRRARCSHENHRLKLPHPTRKHVELRHSQRGPLHLPLPSCPRPICWKTEKIQLQGPDRAAANGSRADHSRLGNDLGRHCGVLQTQICPT